MAIMDKNELNQLNDAKCKWYKLFDTLLDNIKSLGGTVTPDVVISTGVKIDNHVYKHMNLSHLTISKMLLGTEDIVLHFMDENNPYGTIRVMVSRAFEAKAFGDVRNIEELFDIILHMTNWKQLSNNNKGNIKNMAKVDYYKKGTPVSAKKFSGEEFLGVYEHSYDDGSHCVTDGKKFWCVNHDDVREATPEETKIIQETVVKPMKEAEKKKKEESQYHEPHFLNQNELSEEDFEEAMEEETVTAE